MDGQDEWELSKENVQPLRQGRNFGNLSIALQPTSTQQLSRLRSERQQYEISIRTYDGDDPLSVWDTYIKWTEQNFPKGGKDSNLSQLLEQCVAKFKDEEMYKNDERYLRIWLKFANFCSDPLEIFSFLFDQHIGSRLSLLYEAWSSELERVGNHKKADMVFEKGLQFGAEPIEQLQKKHREFQTRVARLAVNTMNASSDSTQAEADEHERNALGELRGHGKKARVAHDRVAGARAGSQRGLQMQSVKPLGNSNGPGFKVFSDENADQSSLPNPAGEWAQAPSKSAKKENEQKAGVWTSSKVKQRNVSSIDVKDVSRHCQNQFSVFVDENTPQPTQTPRKPLEVNQVLSARKPAKPVDPFHHMQHMNEPGNLRPMYPKHKVYTGAGEMSLEELRAAEWREKQNKKLMQEQAEVLQKKQEEVAQQQEMLRQQQEQLRQREEQFILMQQQLQLQKLHELEIKDTPVEKMESSSIKKPNQSQVAEWMDSSVGTDTNQSIGSSMSKPVLAVHPPPVSSHQTTRSTNANTSVGASSKNASFGAGTSLTTPNMSLLRPTPDSSHLSGSMRSSLRSLGTPRSGSLSAPSPTVNTREAMQMVRGMFNNTLDIEKNLGWQCRLGGGDDTEFENQFAATTVDSMKQEPFQIFTDKSEESGTKAPPFMIFDENAAASKPAPFTIFDENKKEDEHRAGKNSFQIFDENAPHSSFKIHTDQENSASVKSKAKGLVPRKNENAEQQPCDVNKENESIKEVPLKSEAMTMQEKLQRANMDWDVADQTEIITTSDRVAADLPDFDGGDMTFAPGLSSTINFTAAARLASTPFNAMGDMVAFPEPPISHIKPMPPVSASGEGHSTMMTESSLMSNTAASNMQDSEPATDKRRVSAFVETGVPNLSPIMEQSDEDKNQTATATKGSQNAFANVTNRDHYASHSHIAPNMTHGTTTVEHSTIGAPTPKPLALDQSSFHKSAHFEDAEDLPKNCTFSPEAIHRSLEPVQEPDLDSDSDDKPSNMSYRVPLNNMTMHEIDITNYIAPDEDDEKQQFLLDQSVAIDPNDPFDEDLVARFLAKLDTPIESHECYVSVPGPLPKVKVDNVYTFGDDMYHIQGKLGEGAYAKVYRCTRMEPEGDANDMDLDEDYKVMKVQKPACPWEFYITHELHERLAGISCDYDIRPSIMKIERGYFFEDGSCLVNELHSNGTLLDLVNMLKEIGFTMNKRGNSVNQMLFVYFTIELLHIAEKLQKTRIIHGDIKPDNILIIGYPFQIADYGPEQLIGGKSKVLKLIDFGRGIDLDMFPDNTTFTAKVTTSGFQCIEMMTNRPWTYQTDLFGIVGCIHVLLFEEYMKVYQEGNVWKATRYLTRYVSSSGLYKALFHDLLNIPSCDELPDLAAHRKKFEKFFLDNLKSDKALQEFRQCLKNLSVQHFRKG